ncbi:peptidylprolyl isomerase [Stenomitos frigidus]|uniref:peptidylprolyl isomerase n=1 Tax=Stenomitos frigidus ULC18 TaxID=2107698 RepID=A0A2T1ES43_9CYAN|nr:peptidylprolyl isomerase [Stenomitos frigidus]PSB35555.1 peptidylprolyl isomerase [Stenomitos frigidus ULC18]
MQLQGFDRFKFDRFKQWLKAVATLLLMATLSLGLSAAASRPANIMPAGNAITDGKALLRYALPIDNTPVRELQRSLEDIATQLRANRRWGAIAGDVKKASWVLRDKEAALLASIPEARQAQAQDLLTQLKEGLVPLQTAVEAKNKEQTFAQRSQLLNLVSQLEESMVKDFPFEVPTAYSNLPQLKGRATIEFTTNKGKLTAIVDGYSAPVTAGNFVDLVQRGFYNNLPFTRSEESYVLQIGDPPGDDVGFIDPKTKKYRAIPLEVLVQGDIEPTYEITLEDAGRYKDQPVLPFSSYGALAMARPGEDPNGGSSQFFFFLFEPELTPAGRNLLDGRYSVFGYVIEGKDVLEQLRAGDKIESAKVTQGLNALVEPKTA